MIQSKEQLHSKIRLATINIFIRESDQLAKSVERIGFLKEEYGNDSFAKMIIDSEMQVARAECDRIADLMIAEAKKLGKEYMAVQMSDDVYGLKGEGK